MKNIIFMIAAFLLFASAAFGQETVTTPKPIVQKPQPSGIDVRVAEQTPDFSGTWTLNRTTSKLNDQFGAAPTYIKVVQAANDLDVERHSSMQGDDVTVKDKFTLDGKECINPGWADSEKRSTAVWSGDKASLVITSKISLGDNGDMTIIEVYRLKDKHLVIETRASSFFGEVAEKLVFDRK